MSKYRLFTDVEIPIDTYDKWDIVISFKDIWEKYNNNEIDISNYANLYKYRINENKDNIINKKGVDVWNKLVIILNSLKEYNEYNCNVKFDEVYSWADRNNIKIEV